MALKILDSDENTCDGVCYACEYKNKCKKEFKRFLKNQDLEIKRLKSNNFKNKNKNFGM